MADEPNHLVDVVDRGDEAFDDMLALAGLPKVVIGPAPHDRDPVVDVRLERLLQAEDLRLAVDEGEVDHAERLLHLRVVVQLVQDDVLDRVPLQLEDDPHSLPVALVPKVHDALDLLRLHEQGDRLDEGRLVDHVRDLGDHDPRLVVARLLDVGGRPDPDEPATRLVRIRDAFGAVQDAARGEVGPADRTGVRVVQVLEFRARVLDERQQRVDDFPQVVRRDVRRHADRDAARPVHEEVREFGGQDRRLSHRAIEVVHPVDRFLVDVLEELLGDLREAALGIPHRRGFVLRAAPVSLAVDERVAQREVLHHAGEGVVDRRVAVRMVPPERVSDDAGRLPPLARRRRTRLVHRVEDSSLDRLQAVPDVRERPSDDDRHGVIDVRALHLLLDRLAGDPPRRFLGLLRHRATPRCPGSRLPSRAPGCTRAVARPPLP